MSTFFDQLMNVLDVVVVVLVLLSGFFQKKYFQGFKLSSNESYDSALKTLALSFAVSIIYIVLIKDPTRANNWSRYFLSYFAATSLYELLVSPFTKWLQSKFGQ